MSIENPQSRVEGILKATVDGTEYTKQPLSRVEEDLLELKSVIEQGGGGGGTTDYNQLNNKPSLNGTTLAGELTSKDVDVESDYNTTYDPEEERLVISKATPNSGT